MKRLIAAWAIMACLFGVAPAAPRDPWGFTPVINMFRFDGVETTVKWDTCGQVNAYYQHRTKTVTMCTELRVLPAGVIRYILAHELSHAVIMQRNIAYTGSHEAAADELAAMMLVMMGYEEDILAGARFWLSMNRPESPWDDHPGDERRASNLLCMVWTKEHREGAAAICNTSYDRVVAAWVRLLALL